MSEQTGKIATGPDDPRWSEFLETLPGFQDFIQRDLEER
jgi:hypothetical protein